MKKTSGLFVILSVAFFTSPLYAKPKQAESKPASLVKFFSFGDWGSGTQDQKNVASESSKICKELGCDFGLLLGDNFYEFGVSGTQDPLWKTRYQDIYTGLSMPFYVALGNHDWRGNAQAQVDFSQKDARWKMPAFFYSIKYPEQSPMMEIFVLNSNKFDLEQQTWLKKALNESKAKWKMLAFHHPILNTGNKHPPDQMHLWPALKPIICGKIDLILSGHEHIFAHLRPQSSECKYDQIIVGTGGKELYGVTTPHPDTLKLAADASFGSAWFEVSPQKISLKFFRVNGENSYAYTWEKK